MQESRRSVRRHWREILTIVVDKGAYREVSVLRAGITENCLTAKNRIAALPNVGKEMKCVLSILDKTTLNVQTSNIVHLHCEAVPICSVQVRQSAELAC